MGATRVPVIPGGEDKNRVAEGGAATRRLTMDWLGKSEPSSDPRHEAIENRTPNGPAPYDRGNRAV